MFTRNSMWDVTLIGFIIFFSYFTQSFSQSIAPFLGSSRSVALGNIFTITTKGADGLSGNPAGLAALDHVQLFMQMRSHVYGKDDFESDYYFQNQNLPDDVNFDYSSSIGFYPKLLTGAVAVPFNFSALPFPIIGGIGYRSVYDVSKKFKSTNTISTDQNSSSTETTELTRGLLNYISIAGGAPITEKLHVGISINIPFLSGLYEESEITQSTNNLTTSNRTITEKTTSGGGFWQIGAIWNGGKYALGFSYIGSHSYKFKKEKIKQFANGELLNTSTSSILQKIELPSTFALGGAYYISPELQLLVEIQNRKWGDINPIFDNKFAYRFGIEYSSSLSYRLGFEIDPLPELDLDQEMVNLKNLTGGISYQSNTYTIDLGLSFKFATYSAQRLNNNIYDHQIRYLNLFLGVKYNLDYSFQNL